MRLNEWNLLSVLFSKPEKTIVISCNGVEQMSIDLPEASSLKFLDLLRSPILLGGHSDKLVEKDTLISKNLFHGLMKGLSISVSRSKRTEEVVHREGPES